MQQFNKNAVVLTMLFVEKSPIRKHFIYLWPNEPLPMMLRWILDAVTAYQPGG
ncbi:hypothetical protein ACOI37_15030 [Escherichia coli]